VWGRQAGLLGIALLGWGTATAAGADDWVGSQQYRQVAVSLLAVGLFSSTHGIDPVEVRSNRRLILTAVTIGVLVKAALIATTMVVVFGRPEYLLLGVAVAQVDPLSVAAARDRSRMSERAKAVMGAWASFDDPMTVLISFYCLDLTAGLTGSASSLPRGERDWTVLHLGVDLLLNLLLVVGASLVWHLLRTSPGLFNNRREPTLLRDAVQVAALAVLVVTAIHWSLFLGLAVTGLFFRPRRIGSLARISTACLVLATFGLGMVLVHGISPFEGAVLGVAAFCAHAVTALGLTRGGRPRGGTGARAPRYGRDDRGRLALGQQNGITAIILALVLEIDFPGTVAAVAPAILLVNLVHGASNALWDRWGDSVPDAGRARSAGRPAQ